MRWRFHGKSLACAAVLFIALVVLATRGAGWGWVRGFGGDVLAVAWVYYSVKAFVAVRPLPLALFAFGVGVLVEAAQLAASVAGLQIGNRVLRIVLGSTPDILDVLAYGLGAAAVLAIEAWHRPAALSGRSTS